MFSAVDVVRSVAYYAVTYGRNHSPLGRNLLFCMNRYKYSLCDRPIFRPNISRIDGFIVKSFFIYSTVSSLQQANFLRECVMVQDGLLTLPNWFSVSDNDVIIDCLCCDYLSRAISSIA